MISVTIEEYQRRDQRYLAEQESVRANDKENGNGINVQVNQSQPDKQPTPKLDQLIISAVQKRTALWRKDQLCNTPSENLHIWEEVCKEVGLPVTDRGLVKTKWNDLRSRYMKARQTFLKYESSNSGRASKAAGKKFKSGYIYWEDMSFLADTVDVPS